MSLLSLKLGMGTFFLCSFFYCNAQVKNEREYRISNEEFPERAVEEIKDFLEAAKRVRYFQEFDNDKLSYEVKMTIDGYKHSIEFDSVGNLKDIETYIKEREIPSATDKAIEKYLDSEFTRYRIVKVQRQYIETAFDNRENLYKSALEGRTDENINYEIVVAGRKKKGFKDYEITFNGTGDVLNVREFISLSYDHILY